MKEVTIGLSDDDQTIYNTFMNYDRSVNQQFVLTGIERYDCGSVHKMHFVRKYKNDNITIRVDVINTNIKYGVRTNLLNCNDLNHECFIDCKKDTYHVKFESCNLEKVLKFIDGYIYLINNGVL